MSKKAKDLTVSEASDILGVSTRSILNYIKAKEIDGIKVGKCWYIKTASLDAFSKRFDFQGTRSKEEKKNFTRQRKQKEKSEKKYSVKDLRLFERACEILNMDELRNFIHSDSTIASRVKELRLTAFELLGAGYYTYGSSKKMKIYDRSRENVGALLAIIFSQKENENMSKVITEIEGELLPAYSALIKRMDKISENIKNI